jgi:uncharacterized membrane protein (UPF0127 family)
VILLLGVAVLAALPALRDGPVGFSRASATIVRSDGTAHSLCLLLAETAAQRQRGLMGVTDPGLGGCDGMVFRFPRDTMTPFWMRNTPLPLSIAYFDSRGRLVSTAEMSPCGDRANCPGYPPSAPYRYAVEVPQGRLPELGITSGSRLVPGSIRSEGPATARVTRTAIRETVARGVA